MQPPDRALRNLRITSEPHASQEEITFVREAIARHNVAVTRDTYYSPLAIFLRDERDAIMGGAFGDVWMRHPMTDAEPGR